MRTVSICLILCILSVSVSAQQQTITGRSAFKKVTAGNADPAKKVKDFPDLIIRSEAFDDPNGNNRIDGNESSSIRFTVENIGKGVAKEVVAAIQLKNDIISGLEFNTVKDIGEIPPLEKREVVIPLQGKMNLVKGIAEFKIEVKEKQGFDAFPLEMKIETNPFEPPRVIVADAVFSTESGGKLKLNTPLQMKFVVQNIGNGNASEVRVECRLPEHCLLTGESDKFNAGTLAPGESREFDFLFIATRRYTAKSIPVRAIATESFGRYGKDTTLSVSLDQELLPQSDVVIAAIPTTEVNIQKASLTSSVDKNIPENPGKNINRFALVIGNEEYTKYQPTLQSEMNVTFARNDALVIKDYLIRMLGFPSENVYLLLDATAGEMSQKIDLLTKLAIRTGKDAELLFYYAGHGLPDESTRTPYLIPVDVNGANLTPAIKLSDVYKKFGETGCSRVTVILDACFSGGGRESGLLASRAVKIRPLEGALSGKMVVFSGAKGDQSAMPYRAEKHGLFTFFFLKKLKETSGNITYSAMADYLTRTIPLESLKINQKEQEAVVNVSGEAAMEWEQWLMK